MPPATSNVRQPLKTTTARRSRHGSSAGPHVATALADAPDRRESTVHPLPPGWSARPARTDDAEALHAVLARHETAAKGSPSTGHDEVGAVLAADTHRQVVAVDADDVPRAWASAHDRAAGRVLVGVTVDPALARSAADTVGAGLFDWAERTGLAVADARGLSGTQLDSGAFADDERQQAWLRTAGFTHVRSWLQMTRPVAAHEGEPGAFPDPHPTVTVRPVRRSPDGMPERADLVAVHDALETAFVDHFNYHAETFEEFLGRLREDPGHRWDHWWLAEIRDEPGASPRVGGALIGTASGSDGEPDSTYVAYLGVPRAARGKGVARSLLHAVIADAARRGRRHVTLEVDDDSPTGADRLYRSTGFTPVYRTQSWHKDVSA